MEFVLYISFAFTKIETAQFTSVAQFVLIRNPSSKTIARKGENGQRAKRHASKRSPAPLVRLAR
jgi:hypothetical protein